LRLNKKLFDEMEKRYGYLMPWPANTRERTFFESLIITVLSQNTSDNNAIKAFNRLKNTIKVTPENIANADIETIKNAIKPGGLYNIKAERIKNIAKIILDRFNGNLDFILDYPLEVARNKLLEIPGIGKKTADVLLTRIHTYRKIIPIDTHMNRISKRLGLVDDKADYDEIQKALINFFPDDLRERGSALLWLLAKYTCKAQKPKCIECLLKDICRYYLAN
jgi:endonuclease-3